MSRQLVVSIESDSTVNFDDLHDEGWNLISFSKRDGEPIDKYVKSYCNGEVIPANIGLRRKLKVGLAHWLSCYQHSNVVWSLKGEGPQCQWDTAQLAGVLIWDNKPGDIGARTFELRKDDARGFLKYYNDFINGNVYWFNIEDLNSGESESIGGFVGEDAVNECLKDFLKVGDFVKLEGSAGNIFVAPDGVNVVKELVPC